MLRHYVPEIEQVDSVDDPNSTVSPYYEEDPFFSMNEDQIDIRDISNGELNEPNS